MIRVLPIGISFFCFVTFLHGSQPVKICTSSTVLAEIASEVGGTYADVQAFIKPGQDPHEYQLKASDLEAIARADLVLYSGKGFESHFDKLHHSSGGNAAIVNVGDKLPSLTMNTHENHGDHTHSHSSEDPHWWHSIASVKKATKIITQELIKSAPEHKKDFTIRSDEYLKKLDALENWSRFEIAKLPRNKRKLVTSHDAFQYFARDFGFKVFTVYGVSSDDEPSSKAVAELIELIKTENVKAIFAENIENPKVLQEITGETGAKLGGVLYADGLGEGNASTYEGMYRHNVTTIVNALK